MAKLTEAQFRKLAEGHQQGIPMAFLVTLAKAESTLNPTAKKGTHWGLFQVGRKTLDDYNDAFGRGLMPGNLYDPLTNIKVATWELRRISQAYNSNPNMPKRNFADDNFVRLLVQGWHSGWSKGGGAQLTAEWLRRDKKRTTHANVHDYAKNHVILKRMSSQRFLRDPAKHGWERRVAAKYRKVAGRPGLTVPESTRQPGGKGWGLLLLALIVLSRK
jgi:hypothetical protein